MLRTFAEWLSNTPPSLLIQDALWVIPLVQTLHILGIAVALSSVGMIELRIFGLAGTRSTVSETAQRYVPWLWGALAVLAVTGLILIIGEPVRELVNPAFQLKMAMLVVAIAVTIAFQITVRRNAPFWNLAPAHHSVAKALAIIVLLMWLAIPVAGRWIAYMVVDYAG
jgi:hypothetical protein